MQGTPITWPELLARTTEFVGGTVRAYEHGYHQATVQELTTSQSGNFFQVIMKEGTYQRWDPLEMRWIPSDPGHFQGWGTTTTEVYSRPLLMRDGSVCFTVSQMGITVYLYPVNMTIPDKPSY
jgi:hypothetical protein